MTRKHVLTLAFATASVLCALAVVPLFAQTNEPSLGEVARKNRAAKAKRPTTKQTKDEVASRPMSEATVTSYGSSATLGSSPTDASSNSSQASGPATPDTQSSSDSQSSSQPTAQTEPGAAKPDGQTKEDRITQLKKDQESLNGIIEKMKDKLAAESSESRRETYSEVIRHAEEELERKQRELSEAEKSAPKK
jgi:hypothetical protein